jgi:predicted porin
MHHRLLLGSTALVSAGILFTNASPAEAQDGGIEVVLSGYTEFGAKGATDDTLQNQPDRGYTFYMDNEVHIEATGTTDGGLTYGSYAEIEVNSGDSDTGNATVDEVNLFFSGGFGRIELGRNDGAEDLLLAGGEDAQAGTGGVDGDTANLCTGGCIDLNLGDTTKATYFTPRIGGFQLGASYTPESTDDGGRDGAGFDNGFYNLVSGGGNWVGAFGGIDLTLSAVGVYGDGEDNQNDDRKDYAVGGLLGAGGLSFGATWGQKTDFNETNWANLGLEYSFGNAAASVGYTYGDVKRFDDTQHVFVASGNIGLAPGLNLKGDVSYNTEDPGNDNSDGEDQNGTVAGVLSVQLDY